MATATDMSWVVSPGDQFEQARECRPDRVFPEPPKGVELPNRTSALLLHDPYDSLDKHWEAVRAPEGYEKYRSDYVKSDTDSLRLAPNVVERTEPVWVIFDPEHGRGQSPEKLWGNPNLASSEIFSALIQFRGWVSSWFNGASAPYLAGYQLKYDSDWSRVPFLDRLDGGRLLGLDYEWADVSDGFWASPSVREC
jgi:hypothetical protein